MRQVSLIDACTNGNSGVTAYNYRQRYLKLIPSTMRHNGDICSVPRTVGVCEGPVSVAARGKERGGTLGTAGRDSGDTTGNQSSVAKVKRRDTDQTQSSGDLAPLKLHNRMHVQQKGTVVRADTRYRTQRPPGKWTSMQHHLGTEFVTMSIVQTRTRNIRN